MTERVYYQDGYLSELTANIEDIKEVHSESGDNKKIAIALDKTILYPGGGGQPPDIGKLLGDNFVIDVLEHELEGHKIWHIGHLHGRYPTVRDKVTIKLEWKRRYDSMVQHSAQHILSATILKMLGADTTGFQIYENWSKIEIDAEKLDWDIVSEIEVAANSIARSSLRIYDEIDNKEGLRIVKIENFDSSPCGGVHVKNSVETLPIKILRYYRKTSKLLRIEFVAGDRAIYGINRIFNDYWTSLDNMNNKEPPLQERIKELNVKFAETHKKIKDWKEKFKSILMRYIEYNSINVGKWKVSFLEESIEDVEITDEDLSVDFLVVSHDKTKFTIYSRNKLARKLLECLRSNTDIKGGGSDFCVRGIAPSEFEIRDRILECVERLLNEN